MKRTVKPTKPDKMYYRFTENNDWEGEKWHFYIPAKGNEAEVDKLRDNLLKVEHFYKLTEQGECDYELAVKLYTEDTVNTLVENDSSQGYLPKHNKLTGFLKTPKLEVVVGEHEVISWGENFYKGGIKDLMQKRKV